MADTTEQRMLLCAPFGKDAELARQVLENAGLSCFVCKTPGDLLQELHAGAGAVLTVEEILPAGMSGSLSDYVAAQPAWSDLPILVLTKSGADSPWIRQAQERLGNLTLLERPVRTSTLVSAARAALRARLRQYEIRVADQRKDEFLAMLAHELRNPLAPISAAAQLLELVSSNQERVREASEIIVRQVGHMTNLIDDLLDVARVTRGLITLEKQALDIRHVLSQAVEQVNPLISARRHHLTLHLPPDPALVLGDRKRLIQVVTNVLNNASKYTPEQGDIVVRLEVQADDVVLEISDNGIGIAPEMVDQVFELFAQAKRTSDRSQGGLGLGLALAKSLVASHGGSIHAASKGIGKGSVFTLRLPRLNRKPAGTMEMKTIAQEAPVSAKPLRIMVVDDNIDAANTLEMLLDANGHDVSVEYTADSAIERARRISPQVCLLDIGLPDMDGNELARRLRSLPETATAVLIAVTGYNQDQDRKKSVEAGFDHYFIKPLDPAKLSTLLQKISTD
jgi:signal transduction histidine kinase/ActR/RegA family two-component response regulator